MADSVEQAAVRPAKGPSFLLVLQQVFASAVRVEQRHNG